MPVRGAGVDFERMRAHTLKRFEAMILRCLVCIPAWFYLSAGLPAQQTSGATEAAAQATPPQAPSSGPVLTHRPPPTPPKAPEGRIQLNVVMTDGAGKAVRGLTAQDFKLLDNNQALKIVSFHAFDGDRARPTLPVQLLLVIDTVNADFQDLAIQRGEIGKFLLQNGGHLAQPTSIFLLTNTGLRVQPRPSMDGNALAGVLNQLNGVIRTITPAMGADGLVERFQVSVKALTSIAENEARQPGRKLLIWTGRGWPLLRRPDLGDSTRASQLYFDAIVELSTRLREAQITVYGGQPDGAFFYRDFLKPVTKAPQADGPDLSLGVFAIQTGGRGPAMRANNDLAAQMESYVEDASTYYSLTFDPPHGERANEYHALKVLVDQPGLTARTNTGYYNQP